jgi:enoyl-CoA hydratase/carnithine racemase
MSDILQISQQGRVLRLVMNRPEKRNALNLALCSELVATMDRADADPGIGAILLSGNGKAFCSGMDLQEAFTADPGTLSHIHEQLFSAGSRLTKPVVAAVHGPALGGGTGLAANAHVVIAAQDATFGLTEIRLGLWPFLIFRSVTMALGERRSVELSLTGRTFSAEDAAAWGLAQFVVPAADLQDRSGELASALSVASPGAVSSGLSFVQQIRNRTEAEAGEVARLAREQIFEGEDFKEGVRAFQEKRPPRWPSLK